MISFGLVVDSTNLVGYDYCFNRKYTHQSNNNTQWINYVTQLQCCSMSHLVLIDEIQMNTLLKS